MNIPPQVSLNNKRGFLKFFGLPSRGHLLIPKNRSV